MTLGELLKDIDDTQKEYGKDVLEWEVYSEQCTEEDKVFKRGEQKWETIKDSEGWEYFKCVGGGIKWPQKKLFMVAVNY